MRKAPLWNTYEWEDLVNNKRAPTYIRLLKNEIETSHKSHNASDKHSTMDHFVTEMCTYVHISVTKWCIVGYRTGALWDLWGW